VGLEDGSNGVRGFFSEFRPEVPQVSRKKVYLVLHQINEKISVSIHVFSDIFSLIRCITWTFPILVLLGLLEWSPSSFTLNKLECSKQASKAPEYISMG